MRQDRTESYRTLLSPRRAFCYLCSKNSWEAALPNAYHIVHYRKFSVEAGDGRALDVLCRAALDEIDDAKVTRWERIQSRFQVLGDADGRQLTLNKVADLQSAVFGEMCLVQENGLQALLEMNATKVKLSDLTTAEIFDLNESTAPTGTQFIRGLAYWLAVGDHLLFLKTQSMSADMIHGYIHWLIGGTLPAGSVPSFQAEFDRTQFAGDIGDISKIKISGKGMPQMALLSEDSDEHKRSVKTSRKIADRSYLSELAEPLAKVIFGDSRAESLVESLGPEEYLAVDASVSVKGKRTETSKAKLKEITNEVADMSDAKVQVEGKDGKLSEDDAIIRTRMPFNLPHEGSNLLEFDNVADQLQEVYSRFVRDGKIDA